MAEKLVRNGEVELATQTFGDPDSTPVLLIMGAMASMLWWPDLFCSSLADAGNFVVRYDNRDTGLSTHFPQGNPGYESSDMVSDAVAILDCYEIERAHVVGMSLGGMIAQKLAYAHPERVQTLSLISATPLGVGGLPPMTDKYMAHGAAAENLDWGSNPAIFEFILQEGAVLASTKHPHDAEAMKRFLKRDMDRASNFASGTNHFIVGSENHEDSVTKLNLPVLVIHGTSDPVFPIEHGVAFAKFIKGAELVRIDGGGHEIHPNDVPEMVGAIAAFIKRADHDGPDH